MDTLKSYFMYENDTSNISDIFNNLSKQLKIIHSHGMVVPNLSSESIVVDEDYNLSFDNMEYAEDNDFVSQKRRNIVDLAKIILGAYLSLETGFRDFSTVDDEWFAKNVDGINEAIIAEGFEKDYYIELFSGSNEYYSDYLDRMKQMNNLSGSQNVNSYKKVLRTAASSLYEDASEEVPEVVESKTASISAYFYPILVGLSLLVTVSIAIFIKIYNN